MKITKFQHKKSTSEVNKNKLPINTITFDRLEMFNQIYRYVYRTCMKVEPTPSGGIPNGKYKGHDRYIIIVGNQRYELVFVNQYGAFRFVLESSRSKDNCISGKRAVRELFKVFDKYSIDMNKFRVSNGLKIKKDIEKQIIKCLYPSAFGKPIDNCYHIDFNSSYASRICEAYPELRPAYEELYYKRKENNGLYKHVLTNSIGCFQSPYCPDWKERRKSDPYAYTNLSKIAVNGTNAKIREFINKLNKAGKCPILINVDGIWYRSTNGPYHDKDEGSNLGQWKHDVMNAKLWIQSHGNYQYTYKGETHTVIRGKTKKELTKPRETWEFGEIEDENVYLGYRFIEGKGVEEIYE